MNRESARMRIGLLCILLASAFVFYGCGTPAGYDADLTPDHNGERWIGGAPASVQSIAQSRWGAEVRAAMRAHLEAHPWCAWCGAKADLQVHHICPVSRNPALAAEPSNLITLCRECHFVVGHKRNWQRAVWNLRTVIETALDMGPPGDEP